MHIVDMAVKANVRAGSAEPERRNALPYHKQGVNSKDCIAQLDKHLAVDHK